MGSLAKYNLREMRRIHNLRSFVETGTATGDGTALAVAAGFDPIHTIEVDEACAAAAQARFRQFEQVSVWKGTSAYCLPMVLRDLPPEPALFWLDAHFPGAHTGSSGYDDEQNQRRRLPLEDEIEIIRRFRRDTPDVLLIDDARIYQPGPYGGGDLPSDWAPLRGIRRSLDFLREAYEKTHGIVIDYADQGYVMVFPRVSSVVFEP